MITDATPIVALDARLAGGQSTGDSTYWTGLILGLSRVNANFRYLLFSNARKPQSIPESERFQWIRVPARNNRWWSLVSFPLQARKMGAGALHTQYSLSPLAGNTGITTIHDVSFLVGPEWFKPKDRALLKATVPPSARRAARVLTVSESSRGEIESNIPGTAGKVRVTYLAGHPGIVPLKRPAARQYVKKHLALDGPFVLTVGTRWPRKNMQLAIDAMRRLPSDLPHKLILTGKPGWGSEQQDSRVVATGYLPIESLSALYSAADLYLAPSRHEGFGLPLIEAFECGCPVLCSSGGALPEVAGGAAEVQTSWEPADWANTIQDLLHDSSKLDSLRARGLERSKRFTWEETARKTLEVYKEVAI